jgi:acetate kinase
MAIEQPGSQQLNGAILALNAGSSSLKFGLFTSPSETVEPSQAAIGVARRSAEGGHLVRIAGRDGKSLVDERWPGASIEELVPRLLYWIEGEAHLGKVAAVGHRLVHGGMEFGDPVIIDDRIFQALEALVPLAPLHQPACLAPVRIIRELRADWAQIACFDTAFHRTIEPPASRYALPRKFETEGIRRYGFHGLSFESIAVQLLRDEGPGVRSERIVIAHLGSGASLCALRNLESVDTTMGFSTLDGLVMGTRPGSIDPGILLYLMKERGLSAGELEQLLYRESGLLGVSGISSDVEQLLASAAPGAREALELFAFQVARHAGALAATLGGLDRLVFTGGIGEHAAAVRTMIVDRMELFGARLDEQANKACERRLSSDASDILVERRTAQEEMAIARHVYSVVACTKQAGMPAP